MWNYETHASEGNEAGSHVLSFQAARPYHAPIAEARQKTRGLSVDTLLGLVDHLLLINAYRMPKNTPLRLP